MTGDVPGVVQVEFQPRPRFGFDARYRRYLVRFEVDGDELALFVNGCDRKRCALGSADVAWVWTNVELEWEEHHLVEAWLRREPGGLRIEAVVNRKPLLSADLPA